MTTDPAADQTPAPDATTTALARRSKNPRVIVTGCPRSGTTLMMRMLCAALGLDHGLPSESGHADPVVGLWEHPQFRAICKLMLSRAGIDVGGMQLPDDVITRRNRPQPPIRSLGIWNLPQIVKEPKAGIVWPSLRAAFPDAIWVVTTRHPCGLADALQWRTPFLPAGWTATEISRYMRQYVECTLGLPAVLVAMSPKTSRTPILAAIDTVASALEIRPDMQAAMACIDDRRWRSL